MHAQRWLMCTPSISCLQLRRECSNYSCWPGHMCKRSRTDASVSRGTCACHLSQAKCDEILSVLSWQYVGEAMQQALDRSAPVVAALRPFNRDRPIMHWMP